MKSKIFVLLLAIANLNAFALPPCLSDDQNCLIHSCFTMFDRETDKLTKQVSSSRLYIEGTTRAELMNTENNGEMSELHATIQFYGAAGSTVLRGGGVRNQAAFKVYELDSCNVLYVAYRVADGSNGEDALSIQLKTNEPGETPPSQCINNYGYYHTIAYQSLPSIAQENTISGIKSIDFSILFEKAKQEICVKLDGLEEIGQFSKCYSTDVGGGVDWDTGHLGIRTDNIKASFSFDNPSLAGGLGITKSGTNAVNSDRWIEICE